MQAVGKTLNSIGAREARRLFQSFEKGLVKATWKQTWLDLIAARTPPKKNGNPVLCCLACEKP